MTTTNATPEERIGATLKALRERSGYQVAEFAEILGCSRSHLANVEAGRRKLTTVDAAKAAAVLNVPQYVLTT